MNQNDTYREIWEQDLADGWVGGYVSLATYLDSASYMDEWNVFQFVTHNNMTTEGWV